MEQLQGQPQEQHTRSYDDDSVDLQEPTVKSPQQIVQSVLHLLSTDVLVRTRLGQDVTVVRSDFKWFGPSLPHTTIFAVLEFLGVPKIWLDFFRKALQMPMKFTVDGQDAPVRIRQRGTPISGPLSDFLGETVLFCLDYAMNQKMEGSQLFRLHDDIWFWGSQEVCKKGWHVMEDFAKLMGLEYSDDKTGSVTISKERAYLSDDSNLAEVKSVTPVRTSGLPHGHVRWGFLRLDTTGRFLIDQEMVDKHIL